MATRRRSCLVFQGDVDFLFIKFPSRRLTKICPSISTGYCISTAHPHCSRSLGQNTFTDHSKRKHFRDEFMVEVLDRANKQAQYQKQRDYG
ncbi:unnamed protein product [Caretta caretta]